MKYAGKLVKPAALISLIALGTVGYAAAQATHDGHDRRSYETKVVALDASQLSALGDQGWSVKAASPCQSTDSHLAVGNGSATLTGVCVILQRPKL